MSMTTSRRPDRDGTRPTSLRADGSHASEADFAACRALLRQGSKSFHLASKILPARVREPAGALYAFCREADDAIDLGEGGAEALDALAHRLDRVYAGAPDDAVERALADVVARFAIPRTLLDALIEGLAWDESGRRYADIAGLRAYSARVASTVGVITTLIMGVRAPAVLARAADLGVAMQLTNIARDVGEDARAGRLYLPEDWMREAGIDPDAWLQAPRFDAGLGHVVRRLLDAADQLYRRAPSGIACLPGDCRIGIHAARWIYAEIGREVARNGYDSLARRAVVPSWRKACLLGLAARDSFIGGEGGETLSPLAETEFLIEAVQLSPPPAGWVPDERGTARRTLDERIGWTIELFARLQHEERLQRVSGRR